ncbi:hypothetical protein ALC56_02270, partial [Trachymyrmex septentrionalis]
QDNGLQFSPFDIPRYPPFHPPPRNYRVAPANYLIEKREREEKRGNRRERRLLAEQRRREENGRAEGRVAWTEERPRGHPQDGQGGRRRARGNPWKSRGECFVGRHRGGPRSSARAAVDVFCEGKPLSCEEERRARVVTRDSATRRRRATVRALVRRGAVATLRASQTRVALPAFPCVCVLVSPSGLSPGAVLVAGSRRGVDCSMYNHSITATLVTF